MGSVTIAATYGAGGSVVAPAVAEKLGLPLIDRALPVTLATKVAEHLRGALAHDERQPSNVVTRVLSRAIDLSGLHVNVPMPYEGLGADHTVAATEEALRQSADHGGAVVLGRAGVFVLAGRADTLHVRLDGPPSARLLQAVRHEGITQELAAKQQRDADQARAAYIRHFHPRQRWEDPANYHLMIDSTAVSLDTCVELIVSAARDLFARVAELKPTATA